MVEATNTAAATIGGNDLISAATRLSRIWEDWWPYYVMLLPGIVYFVIFHYLPIWEAKLAFEEFRIIGDNIWVGFKHYVTLSKKLTGKGVW